MKLTKYQKARLLEHEWDVIETDEGHMLLLWLRLVDEGVELEFGYDDDSGDSEDSDSDQQDWSM